MAESGESIRLKDMAREDLRRYQDERRAIEQMQELISRLEARVNRLNQPLNPDKVQIQVDNSGPETLLAEIADLQVEYWNKQIQAEQTCREIELRISDLSKPIYQRVLRSEYILGKRREQIALDENYSYRTIRRYQSEALEEYGQKLATFGQENDVL